MRSALLQEKHSQQESDQVSKIYKLRHDLLPFHALLVFAVVVDDNGVTASVKHVGVTG